MDEQYVPEVEKRLVALYESINWMLENISDVGQIAAYRSMLMTLKVGFPEIEEAKKILERDRND